VKLLDLETTKSLDIALSQDLAGICEVRHVMTDQAEDGLVVWIVVDDPAPDVRREIYRRELQLLEDFPGIEFDFNLVYSLGRSTEEIATGARVVYSRRN
jgi:hypothetical protein